MVMIFSIIISHSVEANTEPVAGEKVWSIVLNQEAKNSEENLNKIFILDADGEKINIDVEKSEEFRTVLEVTAEDYFELGEYTLYIEEGFESVTGLKTLESAKKDFTVNTVKTTDTLSGEWTVDYVHQGQLLEITANFNQGIADMVVEVTEQQVKYKGTATYTVEKGYMDMPLPDMGLYLNGKISFYNEDKFKIKTRSGKYAYFFKNN